MPFKEDIDTIISQIPPNADKTELLASLSAYMYDTTLDNIISTYPNDIKNLGFPLKIATMLTYLIDLKPNYHNKCKLLSYIFFKMNNIDIPINPEAVPASGTESGTSTGPIDEPDTEESRLNRMNLLSIAGLLLLDEESINIEPNEENPNEENPNEENPNEDANEETTYL
jgi:hypothetical protein